MMDSLLAPALEAGVGAVCVGTARTVGSGHAVSHIAFGGWLKTWQDEHTPVPEPDRVAVVATTRYDIASISKLLTTVVAMRLVEEERIALDAPISAVLPGYADDRVTLRRLLTHTAGLPPVADLERIPGGRITRRRALLSLVPDRPVGAHVYSCVGFLILGLAIEAVTGRSLARCIHHYILRPLGMTRTRYGPIDPSECAATEYLPELDRGVVHGRVHDESAWSLGGMAGNAGLFSTVTDLLAFAEMIRGGGQDTRTGKRILAEATVEEMLRKQVDTPDSVPYDQGLGFRLGDTATMGDVTDDSVGHSGFTGTLLCIDREEGRSTVVLTNAVHPRRGNIDKAAVLRRTMAAARSLG